MIGHSFKGQCQFVGRLLFGLVITVAALADGQLQGLQQIADQYAKTHDFHGRVLLQSKNKVLVDAAYGLANRELRVPTQLHTKYKIASITKMFTAVLILQLRDAGKLDLNAKIAKYLPNYRADGADKVTVHQLLNHTSGMHNVDAAPTPEGQSPFAVGMHHLQSPATTDQLVQRYYSQKLVGIPGAKFDYNNADYILLGKIIEAITQKSYYLALKDNILGPLKMKDTGMLQQPAIIDGLASSYFFRDDLNALAVDLPVYMENWYAAGAMYSTAADLRLFANALYAGKLIKTDSLAQMIKPGLDDYGYGLWIDVLQSKAGTTIHALRRPGQIMGAQTMLVYYQQADLLVIVLSNTGNTSPDDFAFMLGRKALQGTPLELLAKPAL